MNVGKRLKEIRESKHMSVYRLSLDSGVSESHIRNIERGKKNATVETLEMLINSLNITMSEFFNEDESSHYLMPDENLLLRYYRSLPEDTSKAVLEFCQKMCCQFKML